MATAEHPYRYSLRLPAEDAPAITAVANASGQSINAVLVVAIRNGLPAARALLCRNAGRATAVDPLPDEVLDRIYLGPDDDEEGTRRFMAAQSLGGEE
jgi:hypothetical protein